MEKLKNGILANLKYDVPASIVVFLVAVPLCLGIALASGAPLFSGIIAGVIGGIVVGSLSGSQLGVSGPAAGLAVIVLNAITELGAFDVFLLAVVIGGLIQTILGFAKAGIIGYYFPSSVIKGMLSGIGIIIILKQIPHAFGYDKDYEGDLAFQQMDGQNTFSELFHMFEAINPGAIYYYCPVSGSSSSVGAEIHEKNQVVQNCSRTSHCGCFGYFTKSGIPGYSFSFTAS